MGCLNLQYEVLTYIYSYDLAITILNENICNVQGFVERGTIQFVV